MAATELAATMEVRVGLAGVSPQSSRCVMLGPRPRGEARLLSREIRSHGSFFANWAPTTLPTACRCESRAHLTAGLLPPELPLGRAVPGKAGFWDRCPVLTAGTSNAARTKEQQYITIHSAMFGPTRKSGRTIIIPRTAHAGHGTHAKLMPRKHVTIRKVRNENWLRNLITVM